MSKRHVLSHSDVADILAVDIARALQNAFDLGFRAAGGTCGTPTPHVKRGRARLEDRHKTLTATQPWKAARMSRAAWYKRQAEKRRQAEQRALSAEKST